MHLKYTGIKALLSEQFKTQHYSGLHKICTSRLLVSNEPLIMTSSETTGYNNIGTTDDYT